MAVSRVLMLLIAAFSAASCLPSEAEVKATRQQIRNLIINSGFMEPLMAGCLRLAFHDCVGGVCDGCVQLSNPNNAGLSQYIQALESIDRAAIGMSRADLWALSAIEASILGAQRTPPENGVQPMPNIVFRQGRIDSMIYKCPPRKFPDENKSPVDFIMDNFPRMAGKPHLAVALMGAHTLGRGHSTASGHINPWNNFPNWLDNEYYQSLSNPGQGWHQIQLLNPSNATIYQWVTSKDQFLMLHVDSYMYKKLDMIDNKSQCGFENTGTTVCPDADTADYVRLYAHNNTKWMEDFSEAMQIMLDAGHEDVLKDVGYEEDYSN